MVSPFVRHRLDPAAPVSPPTVSFSMRHCEGATFAIDKGDVGDAQWHTATPIH